MMDDNDVCPLCCEELDMSDRQFFPCKCGYQVCMWCWHRIRESESGLCPACRTPYGDDPHEFSAVDMQEVVKANKEKAAAEKREKDRLRQQQRAEMQLQVQSVGGSAGSGSGTYSSVSAGGSTGVPGSGDGGTTSISLAIDNSHHHGHGGAVVGLASDGVQTPSRIVDRSRSLSIDPPKDRSQLANMRVIRRNLVYAVGLPPAIATEETLKKPDYFGQYGKVSKIVINRNYTGNGDPRRASASAYVTFAHKEDTLACILALDGFYLEGRNIRASYGTSKYCSAFIKNVRCNNPDCTYLHHMGEPEDNFTKQEIQAGYVTSGRDVLAKQQQQMAIATSSSGASSVQATTVTSPVSAAGGNTRRRVGGGGPSGSGKVPVTAIFPPPCFDEPLSTRERSGSSLVPPPQKHVRSASLGAPSSGGAPSSSSAGFAAAAAAASNSLGSVGSTSSGAVRKGSVGSIAALSSKKSHVPATSGIGSTSNSSASITPCSSAVTTTAAAVVAAAANPQTQSSSSSSSSISNAHTTLTPLTPLKRASSLPASAAAKASVMNTSAPSKGSIGGVGTVGFSKGVIAGGKGLTSTRSASAASRTSSSSSSSAVGSVGAVGPKSSSKPVQSAAAPSPDVNVTEDKRPVSGGNSGSSKAIVCGTSVIGGDEKLATNFIGGTTILGGGTLNSLDSGGVFPSAAVGPSSTIGGKRSTLSQAPIGSGHSVPLSSLGSSIGTVGVGQSSSSSPFHLGPIGGRVGVSADDQPAGFGAIGGVTVGGVIAGTSQTGSSIERSHANMNTGVGTIGGGKQHEMVGSGSKEIGTSGIIANWGGSTSADNIFASGGARSPEAIGSYGPSGSNGGTVGIWGSSRGAPVSPSSSNGGVNEIRHSKSFGSTGSLAGDERHRGTSPTQQQPLGSIGTGAFGPTDSKIAFSGQSTKSNCTSVGTSSSALASILGIDLPTGSGSLRESAAVTPPPHASSPRHFPVGHVGGSVLPPTGASSQPPPGSVGVNGYNIPLSSSSSFSSVPIGGVNMEMNNGSTQHQQHPEHDTLWGSNVMSGNLCARVPGDHISMQKQPGAIGTPSAHKQLHEQGSIVGMTTPGVVIGGGGVGGGTAPIGGITIGGGTGPTGVSNDIALLQSLLPGVHITTGGSNNAPHHQQQQAPGLSGHVVHGGSTGNFVAGGGRDNGWNTVGAGAVGAGEFGSGNGSGVVSATGGNNGWGVTVASATSSTAELYAGGPGPSSSSNTGRRGGNSQQGGGSSIW